MKKYILISIAVVVFIAIVVVYTQFIVQPDVSITQFQVEDLQKQNISMEDYVGKPLIIDVWATWCPPCRATLPHLQNLKTKYGDAINIILVSDEEEDKLIKFENSQSYGLTFLHSKVPILEYGIRLIPTSYFYNASGQLINKHTGELDEASLEELIKQIQ